MYIAPAQRTMGSNIVCDTEPQFTVNGPLIAVTAIIMADAAVWPC